MVLVIKVAAPVVEGRKKLGILEGGDTRVVSTVGKRSSLVNS